MKLSDRYQDWLQDDRIREDAPLSPGRKIPLVELQARWFAEEFGREFVATNGDAVAILEFGAWNREAGPSFSGALVSIAGRSPVRGCVELTENASDWGAQPSDPEYPAAILHLFTNGNGAWIRGSTAGGGEIPQVRLDVSRFEFIPNDLDLAKTGDCGAPLAALSPGQATALLEAAAQFRLCRKAARLRRQSNPEAGLFQGLAETLGYRHNKLPFTLLAQRFSLSWIRGEKSAGIEPLLFGGAGFLSATDLGAMAGDTRGYLREIWGKWWPHRAECERLVLPGDLWTLRGVRPVNHPQRRVAALAEIVRNWPVIQAMSRQCEIAAIRGFFSHLTHDYWDFHYTLTSQRSAARMALVGEARVTAMLANVFFPAAVTAAPRFWQAYRELPAQDSNQRVDLAAQRLFGLDAPLRKLLKQAVYQQGLLQLHEDHCMACQGGCEDCGLLEKLKRWNG